MLGLFHGLLVLPVLLAIFGPPSRQQSVQEVRQKFGKTSRSPLRRDIGKGDREVDRGKQDLQQDIHEVDPDATSDDITPLKGGSGEGEEGELGLEVEGGGEEEQKGLLLDRGSSTSIENTGA